MSFPGDGVYLVTGTEEDLNNHLNSLPALLLSEPTPLLDPPHSAVLRMN